MNTNAFQKSYFKTELNKIAEKVFPDLVLELNEIGESLSISDLIDRIDNELNKYEFFDEFSGLDMIEQYELIEEVSREFLERENSFSQLEVQEQLNLV